jgi:TfoX/Sxy family transcriptional regulator of competence genes
MPYDEGLAERIRLLLHDDTYQADGKKMFGGLAFLRGGKMFLGIIGDDLMVRVGPEQYEQALTRPGAREMDFTGRPMRGYVFVGPAGLEDDAELAEWVRLGRKFIEMLFAGC